MKKKIFVSLCVATSLLTATPVFAETDSEILFRDIPWGTSYADTQNILSDFDWYGLSFESMKTYPVLEVLTDDADGTDSFNNGGINMTAQPFSQKETDVAGYTTSDIQLFFAYTSVDGILQDDDTQTALYGARYEFEPQNLQSMYEDVKNKLVSLYGEPDDTTSDKNWLGIKYTYTWWYGANDSVVVLRGADSSEDTTDLYDDELWISYAWEKGDELLESIDNAVTQSNSDAEASVYGNGSTDGL